MSLSAWFWAWLATFIILLYSITAFGKLKTYLETTEQWYKFQEWEIRRKTKRN